MFDAVQHLKDVLGSWFLSQTTCTTIHAYSINDIESIEIDEKRLKNQIIEMFTIDLFKMTRNFVWCIEYLNKMSQTK